MKIKGKVITENYNDILKIMWDGTRFAIIQRDGQRTKTIVLNPKEMDELVKFALFSGRSKYATY